MEKLEKALQRARVERETQFRSGAGTSQTAASVFPANGRTPAGQHAADAEPTRIIYTQTRRAAPSLAALRVNHVVTAGEAGAHAYLFRILRTKVQQELARQNLNTLVVTSALPREGKTFVAVNLALSLAVNAMTTVVLVELDLSNPTFHRVFGIPARRGLTDHLVDGVPLSECLVHLESFDRVVVLPAGTRTQARSELLASPRMRRLASDLRTRYPDRTVVYDAPALFGSDDTAAFLSNAQASLLVLQEGAAQSEAVRRAVGLLAEATTLIGTVVNRSSEPGVSTS
jgi:protein-tyrosine kinase